MRVAFAFIVFVLLAITGCSAAKNPVTPKAAEKKTNRDGQQNNLAKDKGMNSSGRIPPSKDDAWTVAEGTFAGNPTYIRYRPNMAKHLGSADYPRRLTIIWKYKPGSAAEGLPSPDDLEKMHSFEKKISDALEKNSDAVITFIFTSNGQREWNFYIRDAQAVGRIINDTLEPGLPIEIQVEDDPGWSGFSEVLDSVEEKDEDKSK